MRSAARRGSATVLVTAAALLMAACTDGRPTRAADPSLAPPSTSATASATGSTPASSGPGDWLGYHADQARTGAVDDDSPGSVRVAWRARLGGAVRGQPLVAGGRIVAATETNRVVALDPGSGRVLWSTSLGPPLTDVAATAGCGNIDPLGITSTGVIDRSTGTAYVVGEVSDGHGGVRHRLAGLDLATGRIRVSADVDPPLPHGESPVHLLQRASLALGNSRVYVSYGGNLGDCGTYSGWVVGAELADPTSRVSFRVATNGQGGAIWQGGGAPALDADGGPAYDPATGRAFVPCRGGGLQVVDLAQHRLGPRLAGPDSAPIVVGGTVWALDSGTDRLVSFDAASGARRQSVAVGADVPVFASPSAALGLLLVGTADGVVAFR
jgi:outer membrane protein assembly factor BamB